MKFMPMKLLLFFLVFQSANIAFSCDLQLVGLLTAPFEAEQEFSGLVTDIASHTKTLSTTLADFLLKHQKYYFPPKNVNGQFLSSDIEVTKEEANAFVKQFAGQVDQIAVIWDGLRKNSAIHPPWGNDDKIWDQKCQDIESFLKKLKENVIHRDFIVLHDFVSGLYVSILSLLEPEPKDVMQSSLLALSGDIIKLVRGVEQSRIIDIELASFALITHVDKLENSLPQEQRVCLNDLKSTVNELENALKNEQLYLLIELAGKTEQHFGELTESLSGK
ncbi:MAG: hypothetical protein KKB51_15140 [Candidatus Riflebacteria bacterium]|nr:hypothetical protein [Candidatus Riflebacteria bacterium]